MKDLAKFVSAVLVMMAFLVTPIRAAFIPYGATGPPVIPSKNETETRFWRLSGKAPAQYLRQHPLTETESGNSYIA